MTHISSNYQDIVATNANDLAKSRRNSVSANPAEFRRTMESMRQAAELAVADRFLNVSMGWDDQEDEERPGGGIGLNSVGMNMLVTLAKLQAMQAGPALPQAQNPAAEPMARQSGQIGDQATSGTEAKPETAAGQAQDRQTLERQAQARQAAYGPALPMPAMPAMQDMAGELARAFESGRDGSQAIGWDRVGGTSYGVFQLSSRQGTLDRFLQFLDGVAPEWAGRLRQAGPADTGSREGAMPGEWRKIAGESPQLFEALQYRFISDTHYQPAAQAILQQTGLDISAFPKALQEVLFSTAVQHGPTGAAGIFAKATSGLDGILGQQGFSAQDIAEHLIREVYMQRSTRFGSSTERVQAAVRNRFKTEHKLAMGMLDGMDGTESA